jgi:hypothetical protein
VSEDITGQANPRANWTLEERVEHEQDLARRRAEWKEQRRAEKEQAAREEEQARLEAFLKARGERWVDTVRGVPPEHVVEEWANEYITRRAQEEELEQEVRLAEADSVWD